MRVVIVGTGSIGSRHLGCCEQAGHQVLTVDSNGRADCDRVALVPDPSSVDAWVVATPTAAHLLVLEEILRYQPDARVLLEKPVCYPAELPDLTRMIHQHPRCRIVVNDVYTYSRAVRRFAESVRRFSEFDPITRITVEFTKNRELDVANGRFVDTGYGEAGYEFFHMLSIVRSILPGDRYQTYLRTEPALITPEMRVRISAPNVPELEMYASSRGVVGFPELAGFAFSSTAAKHYVARARIPYGVDMRYRFADVELESGVHVTVVFEPSYGTAVDYKNKHVVSIGGAESRHQYTISGNHFDEAVLTQLDLLHHADEGTAVIRLAEHQCMACLGVSVSIDEKFARFESEA
ncbi:hypothetical protein ALI144C_51790 [Actinosynnema sp. ALI-1.44]|uniref:Gfo/Idh/MocA family oxidoreductase n=1 Tax=Actinosynnema sp. ALI-1.44 TaxID=1933779 RepID=UPI00097C1ED8|nr:Gfo/Idh/MocA family oxidoreductase [Actinosynnema sp. ALI-1.44]ONI71043.1 hypothetical protein ALI144C_51790 [Actinosynnema sp. ALI-1.44]